MIGIGIGNKIRIGDKSTIVDPTLGLKFNSCLALIQLLIRISWDYKILLRRTSRKRNLISKSQRLRSLIKKLRLRDLNWSKRSRINPKSRLKKLKKLFKALTKVIKILSKRDIGMLEEILLRSLLISHLNSGNSWPLESSNGKLHKLQKIKKKPLISSRSTNQWKLFKNNNWISPSSII